MRLENKVAVVVGGGQAPGETIGNGRAISLRFAQEGAMVFVVDRDQERAEETSLMIREAGGRSQAISANASKEADCERVIDQVCAAGPLDILYNNVGISRGDQMTTDLPLEAWHHLIDTNLTSAFLMCKHALPPMRTQGGGVILNTSSTASLCWPRTLAYKTTKAALNAMTQHLALDNAPYGIRANAILPGLIDTPMAIERRAQQTGQSRDELRAERAKKVPLAGPDGSAWDIANAALFLASDEARYITGLLMPVDGGMSVRRG